MFTAMNSRPSLLHMEILRAELIAHSDAVLLRLRDFGTLSLNCRTAPFVNTFKIRPKTFLFDSA